MATYCRTVDPNDSNADHTNIEAWNAFVQANTPGYVSGDIVVADCRRTGALKDTTAANIISWPAGVVPHVIVNPAYRHDGKTYDSGYMLHLTIAGNVLTVDIEGAVVDGLNITGAVAQWNTLVYLRKANIIFKNNFLHDTEGPSTDGLSLPTAYNSGVVVKNNIFFNVARFVIDANGAYATTTISNNTIYGGSAGISEITSKTTVKNNIVLNTSGTCYQGTPEASSDNNISSDATAPGANSLHNKTAAETFVDAAGGDFRLKAGSPAINAGTDLSAYFTTDIIGTARPQGAAWDIGAFEFVEAGGGLWDVTFYTLTAAGTLARVDTATRAAGQTLAQAMTDTKAAAATLTTTETDTALGAAVVSSVLHATRAQAGTIETWEALFDTLVAVATEEARDAATTAATATEVAQDVATHAAAGTVVDTLVASRAIAATLGGALHATLAAGATEVSRLVDTRLVASTIDEWVADFATRLAAATVSDATHATATAVATQVSSLAAATGAVATLHALVHDLTAAVATETGATASSRVAAATEAGEQVDTFAAAATQWARDTRTLLAGSTLESREHATLTRLCEHLEALVATAAAAASVEERLHYTRLESALLGEIIRREVLRMASHVVALLRLPSEVTTRLRLRSPIDLE